MDRHGRVFYSVNDGEPVLFHCGVAVGGPLWALIDVYGITDEVQLLGKSRPGPCGEGAGQPKQWFSGSPSAWTGIS